MRFVVRLATYLFAGPFIGAILYFVYFLVIPLYGISASSSSNGSAPAAALGAIFAICLLFPFAVMVSYMIGGVAALVGGLVVALLGPLIPYRPIRPVFAGVVGTLSTYSLWIPIQHFDWSDWELAIIGGISAVICSVFVEWVESRFVARAPA